MTNKQQDIFFIMLSQALWHDGEMSSLNEEDKKILATIVPDNDWRPVLESLYNNVLLGIAAPAIKKTPQHLQPSQRQLQNVIDYTARLFCHRLDMQKAIVEVFNILENEGLKPMLLKGEGLAALYPSGCQRAVGDIDLYVCPSEFEKACIIIDKANGITPDIAAYTASSEHHYHTHFAGFTLEIHHCIADATWERYGTDLNKWTETVLSSSPFRSIQLCGKDILLPPVEFDIFYIFEHLCRHMLGEGGGLRQLIDFGMFLHHVHQNNLPYDRDALHKTLKEFGLLHAWKILTGILHHQLAIDKSEIPFYDESFAKKSHGEILNEMVAGGNFGKTIRDDSHSLLPHGIKRTAIVFASIIKSYKKRRQLFPDTAFQEMLIELRQGIKSRLSALR